MSYKRLGDYIELSNNRNVNLKYNEDDVRGVSNDKKIIKSKSNNKGRSFEKFYIIKPDEFIYNSRTSRMGDKVGLGFNETNETIITSFNNTGFRVKNDLLVPKYLFMWFNRPEFDRYVRFNSWGSSTEIFSWDEMCEVTLPLPSLEKQQQIVDEYNTVTNRIQLNEKINTNLEATAQALYKHWFVDFEFPNAEGKPYKSSGGEMVYNEELDKDIPVGWSVTEISQISGVKSGKSPVNKDKTSEKYKTPIYGAGGISGYTSEILYDEKLISIGRVGTHGVVQRINSSCWLSDNTLIFFSKHYEYLYNILLNINYDELNRGGVQGLITQTDLKEYKILNPQLEIFNKFEDYSGRIFKKIENFKLQSQTLKELQSLLLAKMTKAETEIAIV